MKWILSLVLGLSFIGEVICAGDSTSLTNNEKDQILLEKLIEACEEDNINQAAEIINNIKNLNYQTSDGETVLMIVSCYGYEKVVEILLQYGVDVNAQAENGDTALMLAAENGHEKAVKMLLQYGVDVNVQVQDGATALILAAQNGYEKVVKVLLKYDVGANVQAKNGDTALMQAAQNGHEKVVEVLLRYGVDVNAQRKNGATALMLAAEGGYEKIVRVLLDHKADANKSLHADGATALILSAQYGHEKIVEMLLKYGVICDCLNSHGATALMLAAERGYEKIVRVLLDYKADANKSLHADGSTALMLAAQYGYEKIAKMLLEYGVSCDCLSDNGATALTKAVAFGHKEIAELLICHDADTELKLKESNRTAFDILDNLSDYGISLEDEKIQYLKYILNAAHALVEVGLDSALAQYPQAKEMLIKRALMRINKVYKEDLAIRDANDQQAQSNALLISNLLRVKKAKLSFIQDNYMPILDAVYEDEYFKQQSIEAGHFAEYQLKKYVFRNLSKAIKTQRFSDLVVCTQDNF